MIRSATAVLFSMVLVGCQAALWGPYSSPRVTGQVIAADTRTPLPGVSVSRGYLDRHPGLGWPPKGSELMVRKIPARTDEQGNFVLDSERVLSVFRGTGWNQIRLRFEAPGYLPLQTNYAASFDTHLPSGEPAVGIGQVLLQPSGH